MNGQPELTVGLVIGAERDSGQKSLRHVLAQTAVDRIEVVCVDLHPSGRTIPEALAPPVRYFEGSDLHFIEEAQALCVREARAAYVAFIEDHSFAEPDWAEHVIAAFRDPGVGLVNYSFTHAGEGTYLDRAFIMTEYGRWMHPTYAGPVSIPACNNIAYRIEALAPYLDDLVEQFGVAPMLHAKIQDAGHVAWQAPGAVVAHQGWSQVWAGCWANGIMKRLYGGTRAQRGSWGLPRRVFYAGGMVLAPALHLGRLAWSLRHRRQLWLPYLAALPVSTLVYCTSSLQEALGYLFGPGRSREEFTEMELSVSRQS